MGGSKLKKVRITAAEIQQRYNAGPIPARILSGVYHLEEIPPTHLAPASLNMPKGTRSVMYNVLNKNGVVLAKVHAYVRPDASYGASGKLDPKYLLFGTTIYYV